MKASRRARASLPGGAAAARAAPRAIPGWALVALPVAAWLALLWSCRGALGGSPVADDWMFLGRLRFQHPLDPFDSMGAAYYWRPLSRQLVWWLTGRWVSAGLGAPWNPALLAGFAAAVGLTLKRTASPVVASLVAAALVSSEPARVLVCWASGSQHLLAAFLAALAVHEAAAGRRWTSGLAALGGVLAHELGAIALPLLPLVAPARDRRGRLAWAGISAGVLAAWLAGYAVARAHGVALPPGVRPAALASLPAIALDVGRAALNAEEISPYQRPMLFAFAVVVLAAGALVAAASGAARARLSRAAPAAVVLLALAALTASPLAALLPDWNAWRALVPIAALVVAATVALGSLHPGLAGALVALRLVALLAATPAPDRIGDFPRSISDVSFPRLVRLKRTVAAGRAALLAARPQLPPGARIAHWGIPRYTEVGFGAGWAPRVWYGDTAITFGLFGGIAGFKHMPAVMLCFSIDDPRWPAVVIRDTTMHAFAAAVAEAPLQHFAREDSLFHLVIRLQQPPAPFMTGQVYRNLARLALARSDFAAADSLDILAWTLAGQDPDDYAVRACVALSRGRTEVARSELAQCLALQPTNELGLQAKAILAKLDAAGARGAPP